MIRIQILCLATMSVLASACYDSGTKTDCVGLSCGAGLQWPDGGEASIRYVRYPDGTEWRAFIAFFIDEQKPVSIDVGELNKCSTDPGFAADMRHFFDVGESVTFHMGSQDVKVDKVTGSDAVDYTGRHFDVAYYLETYGPVPADFFNAYHSMTADDGSMPAVVDDIYMPPKLDIVAPPVAADSSFISIKKGQDLTVEWAEEEEVPREITTLAAIFFIDVTNPGVFPMACFSFNTGKFVVPKDIVDGLPPTGLLQIGTVSNEATLSNAERRIDTWGTNCSAVPYVLEN